jgi:Sortase domain
VLAPRPAAITVAAGLLVIAGGSAGLLVTRHSTPGMRPPPRGVATVAAPTGPIAPPQSEIPIARLTPVARPVWLTIPVIGVRTRLITLGLTADGAMQVPSSTAVAGWYTGSPRPGAIGPAVIAGHVDSLTGPGVFYRLSELRPGDRVYIRRADGTTVEFRVTAVQIYLKAYFPTNAVYGPTPDAELRLITCGGTFDYATGHYLSNVIVYSTEVS